MKIVITLAIFGIRFKIEKLSTEKRSMYIHISGWHTFDFGYVRCLIVTGWNTRRCWWMWCRFWFGLAESLSWRCTRAFASPACLGILCCAILAREAALSLIFPKHSRVSFHGSLHIFIPRKIHSPLLLLFLDCGLRFLD